MRALIQIRNLHRLMYILLMKFRFEVQKTQIQIPPMVVRLERILVVRLTLHSGAKEVGDRRILLGEKRTLILPDFGRSLFFDSEFTCWFQPSYRHILAEYLEFNLQLNVNGFHFKEMLVSKNPFESRIDASFFSQAQKTCFQKKTCKSSKTENLQDFSVKPAVYNGIKHA
jgi:hypothetical protein